MAHLRSYHVVAEYDPPTQQWALFFPQMPWVFSVAETRADVVLQASDALLTGLDCLAEDGDTFPPCIEEGAELDPTGLAEYEKPEVLVVTVEALAQWVPRLP